MRRPARLTARLCTQPKTEPVYGSMLQKVFSKNDTQKRVLAIVNWAVLDCPVPVSELWPAERIRRRKWEIPLAPHSAPRLRALELNVAMSAPALRGVYWS